MGILLFYKDLLHCIILLTMLGIAERLKRSIQKHPSTDRAEEFSGFWGNT